MGMQHGGIFTFTFSGKTGFHKESMITTQVIYYFLY